ncbi:MAG: 4-(cytidine 5'-diphospho)-2-C-methyl-D-erythritol kinase [Oscillospiraceae bacterium]|nr:4-(cytidine 5'-diphospho)-2-C-methyl-D-erythritol kinase [Oscillospiraceae bacterium]
MTELAYAKINLYLDCIGKREDGYHELVSVMHTISMADIVTVTPSDGIHITCSDPDIPTDERNIAYKCAAAYMDAFGTGGADIHIEKHIPSQAGLGGGSADGAAVLRAMHSIYGAVLDGNVVDGDGLDALIHTAAGCGADIPFCLVGGAALCEGIGERMTPLLPMDGAVIVAKGQAGISTPAAYRLIDALPETEHMTAAEVVRRYSDGSLPLYNIFEQTGTVPDVERIKDILGPRSLMTGSGSAVFAPVSDRAYAEDMVRVLRGEGFLAGIYDLTGEII